MVSLIPNKNQHSFRERNISNKRLNREKKKKMLNILLIKHTPE